MLTSTPVVKMYKVGSLKDIARHLNKASSYRQQSLKIVIIHKTFYGLEKKTDGKHPIIHKYYNMMLFWRMVHTRYHHANIYIYYPRLFYQDRGLVLVVGLQPIRAMTSLFESQTIYPYGQSQYGGIWTYNPAESMHP